MKRKITLFLYSMIAMGVCGQALPDGVTYPKKEINGIEYTLESLWFDNEGFIQQKKKNVSYFFVYDGDLYFNHIKTDDEDSVYKVSGTDGMHDEDLHSLTVDWGGNRPNGQPLGGSGNDSEGNPYIISRSNGSPEYPFELYVINLENGRPCVDRRITIPFYPSDFGGGTTMNRFTREAQVSGDITTGNFFLAAPIWSIMDPGDNETPITYIGVWTFENFQATSLETAKIKFTLAHVIPISSDCFAVVDANDFQVHGASLNGCIDPRPSIYRIVNGTAILESTFPCADGIHSGNGMDIFNLGENTFMAYASTSDPKFKIARLENYPASINGSELWELAPDNTWSSNTRPSAYDRTVVKAWKKDDTNMLIFMSSNNGGMAAYNLSMYDPTVTGIDDVSVDVPERNTAEYYDLQGRRIINPESGGIYIVRRGSKVVKEYIR